MKTNSYNLLYLWMVGKTKEEVETLLLDPKENGEEHIFYPDSGFCYEEF